MLLPCRPLRIEVISIDLTGDCGVPLSSPSSILEKTSWLRPHLERGTRLDGGPRTSRSPSLSSLSRSRSALFCRDSTTVSRLRHDSRTTKTSTCPEPYLYLFAVLYFWYVLIGRAHDLVCFDPFVISRMEYKDRTGSSRGSWGRSRGASSHSTAAQTPPPPEATRQATTAKRSTPMELW